MKKIPCLFEREGNPYRAIDKQAVDITGAEATVKIDGTCCMVKDGVLYKRQAIKPGKPLPEGFIHVDTRTDEDGGKRLGWLPVSKDNPNDQHHFKAEMPTENGTYELIGPKIQGNPYGLDEYNLSKHGDVRIVADLATHESIKEYLTDPCVEGVVWWRDGEPIAKIKCKDFSIPWP